MGWREFNAWLDQMSRDRMGGEPDPGSWDDPVSRQNFDELAEVRRKRRGR